MNLFSFIKSNISIESVVGEYVTLKRAGLYLKANCPFHAERTASFTVSPHREIFYCFGCHLGGDVISFIAAIEGCSQVEAARHLVDRYNLAVPKDLINESGISNVDLQKKNSYFDLCLQVALWCNQELAKNQAAHSYLTERSISQKSIDQFTLGYFPSGARAIKQLIAYVQQQSFLASNLVEANIIVLAGGGQHYSLFEERIIFPIKDHLGRVCGFGGRIFMPNDERVKYYNSHENQFFTKGALLYGLDQAKKEIQKQDIAIMVEGYTDCIALYERAFGNCVATLGTACTPEHLKLLARYTQMVYVMYDGDQAGQKAILRLTELGWNVNLELKIISLPAGEDPASFCERGGDMRALICQAQDIFTFFIQTMGTNLATKTLNEKLTLAQKMINLIMRVPEPLKRELLINQAAGALGLSVDILKKELSSLWYRARKPLVSNQKEFVVPVESICKIESALFALLFLNLQFLDIEAIGAIEDYFCEPLKIIIKKARQLRAINRSIDFVQLFDEFEQSQQLLINRLLLAYDGHVSEKELVSLLLQLYKKHWQLKVNNVKEKLRVAVGAGNNDEVKELLVNFQEMKKKLRERDGLWRGSK